MADYQLDTSSIKSPGATGLPPNLDSGSGGNLSDMIAKLMQPSAEEKSASKAREQATAAATDSLKNRSKDEAATTAELEKNMPTPEDFGLGKDELKAMEPGKSPSYKPDDPLQNFGGIATLIGVFGGMLTRHPVIASLNAASGAMKAAHERNIEDYEKQVEEWKNNQDYVSKVLNWREQMYAAADKKFANDLSARQAARTEVAARTQDTMTLQQITAGDEQRYYQTRNDAANLLLKMQENNERLKISAGELGERIRADHARENLGSGQPADPEMQKAYASQVATGQPLLEVVPGGMSRAASQDRQQAHDAAVRLIADEKKIPLTEAAVELSIRQANYRGLESEQRTLGNQAARLNVAGRAAYKAGDMVVNSSAKVSRTDFVSLNDGLLSVEKKFSDPAVATYIANLNTFINTYARAISPTGQARVSDKEHARDMIVTGYGKGAVDAVIASLKQEVANEQISVQESRQDIGNEIAGKGPTPLAAIGTRDNPIEISNESEADLYDKGTWVKLGKRLGQTQ